MTSSPPTAKIDLIGRNDTLQTTEWKLTLTPVPSAIQIQLNTDHTISLIYKDSTPTPIPTPTPTPTPIPTPTPTPTPSTKKIVKGYYGEWSIYNRNFPVSSIRGDKLTHILYAFVLANPNQGDYDLMAAHTQFTPKPYDPKVPEGTIVLYDGYAATQFGGNGNLGQLQQLKLKYPHLKVAISIGGWTLSWNLSKIMANATMRKRFVTSAVDMVLKYGFDGIDVDWEFPARKGLSYNYVDVDNDAKNMTLMFKEIREELNIRSPTKYIELSAATGADPKVIACYKDSIGYLDMLSIMTYDFRGDWDVNTGHHSPLYKNALDNYAPVGFSADEAVNKAIDVGFTRDKLTIGVPFYGRGWTKVVVDGTKPLIFGKSTAGGASSRSPNGNESFAMTAYRDLLPLIKNGTFTDMYDSVSKASWCYSASGEVWTYESQKSVADKAKYINDKGVAGAIIWDLQEDTTDSTSLLTTFTNELYTTTTISPDSPVVEPVVTPVVEPVVTPVVEPVVTPVEPVVTPIVNNRLMITVGVTNQWSTGSAQMYQVQVTVRNITLHTLSDIKLSIPSSMSSVWDVTNNKTYLSLPSWLVANGGLIAGQSMSFGGVFTEIPNFVELN